MELEKIFSRDKKCFKKLHSYGLYHNRVFLACFRESPSAPIFGSAGCSTMAHCEDWMEGRRSEALWGTGNNSKGPWTLPMKTIQLVRNRFVFELKALGTSRAHEVRRTENSWSNSPRIWHYSGHVWRGIKRSAGIKRRAGYKVMSSSVSGWGISS